MVIALEPNPSVAELLASNVGSLGDRVQIRQVALAGYSGKRMFTDDGLPGGSSILDRNRSGGRRFWVDTIALDSLIAEAGWPVVDLLKMDIEGGEQEVFENISVSTLGRVRCVIIECHPSAGADTQAIAAKLRLSGMEVGSEANRLLVGWRV
jgi:FkbM family methyltransferase